MIRKTLPLAAALGLLALGACNTVNGVGKDVRSAGTAVSDASGQNHKK
ncbi:entericidin A/B family lipoprotein [Sphingomonas sp. TDK1]|nr:entericidin A/B family lipoprotein [Sphingomonas sp. TDK1]